MQKIIVPDPVGSQKLEVTSANPTAAPGCHCFVVAYHGHHHHEEIANYAKLPGKQQD